MLYTFPVVASIVYNGIDFKLDTAAMRQMAITIHIYQWPVFLILLSKMYLSNKKKNKTIPKKKKSQ